jgi:hypothetical protein
MRSALPLRVKSLDPLKKMDAISSVQRDSW